MDKEIHNKENFEEILLLLDYDFHEYSEFLQEHYQNGLSNMKNLESFDDFIETRT